MSGPPDGTHDMGTLPYRPAGTAVMGGGTVSLT
jgi:hypothetical protein